MRVSASLWCFCPAPSFLHTSTHISRDWRKQYTNNPHSPYFTLLHKHTHTHKCFSTVSCFLPLPLALARNVLPLSVLKTQSFVRVVRAENGPDPCLKWGTVVYKKHAHLLKYFIGKRLIVPLRCISFLQGFFHPLTVWCHFLFCKTIKSICVPNQSIISIYR